MHAQRGFTLAELLVSTAIGAMLTIGLVAAAHAYAGWSQRAASRSGADAALDRLEERLDAQTASAWSVFVPSRDVRGDENADGHELDVATRDALGRASFRAYRYDAASARVETFVYGTPGDAPIATGDVVDDVTAFAATSAPASATGDALFAASHAADAEVPLGFGIAEATGGNRLTFLRVAIGRYERSLALAAATAPSTITVVLRYTPSP